MKYAIISDIHSNKHALEKVLDIIEKENIDQIICLGDIVGYNAFPSECIKIVKSHPKIKDILRGNHDKDTANFDNLKMSQVMEMHPDAYAGIEYSKSKVNDNEKKWLNSLPEEKLIKDPHLPFLICHYSPNYCTYFGYPI